MRANTMKGLLLYDREGIERNAWFAGELVRLARDHGMDLEVKVVEKHAAFSCPVLPDFAIVRVIAPQINAYFEEQGVPVFNNYQTSYYGNNKWRTYELAQSLHLPTMPTFLPAESWEEKRLSYPFILKSLDGHGGKEVFKIRGQAEYACYAKQFENNCLIQQRCSNEGKDVRVYCLGEQILVAVLRESASDFRSNFSLGGNASVFSPTSSMLRAVRALYQALRFDLVGVDFILHDGEWVFNELEDVVGTRMAYACTDINVADLYVQYIKEKLSS